ncbi:MAG: hypothetical protein LBL00_06990 [Endomicrobium sp.]|jgi:hypothetical protein|nr:hypothetical protein [Endomicrobium sp.]
MRKKIFVVIAIFVFFSGFSFAQKKSVNPNSPEDVADLTADAQRGDRGAQFELSMVYTYKKDMENALLWLNKSAENGYGRAQYTLGNLYYKGNSAVKRDYEKAIKWFEASKETAYKGSKIDELIASAKQKLTEQKSTVVTAKKKADAAAVAKKHAAAEAERKAKAAAAEAARLAEEEAKAKAAAEAAEAAEAARLAAEKAAAEAAAEAERIAAERRVFNVVKQTVLSYKDKILGFFGLK